MNYARNEDMLCGTTTGNAPAYSSIVSIAFSNEGAELITLAEAKAYLRIDASETAFDAQVTMAISAARMAVEEYLNRSLISRTITVTMNIARGGVNLPYAPVIDVITSVQDNEGNVIDTGSYQQNSEAVYSLWYNQATFTYNAGYVELPPAFKLGILKLMAFDWQHTGDDGTARSIGAITGLKMYRRVV
jgi:hypothetical protein